MENKRSLSFPFIIITIILGVSLWREFNFETLTFRKPALAIVYMVTFVFSSYVLIKSYKKRSEK